MQLYRAVAQEDSASPDGDNIVMVFDRIVPPRLQYLSLPIWFLVSVTVTLIGLLIFKLAVPQSHGYGWIALTLGLGVFTIPLVFRLSLRLLLNWVEHFPNFITDDPEAARALFLRKMRFFRGSRAMYLTGAIIAAAAVYTYLTGGFFDGLPVMPVLYISALIAASAFFAGMGLYAVLSGTRAIFQIGDQHSIRIELDKFGVMSTGIVMTRIFLAIGLAWSLYLLSAFAESSEVLLGLPVITPPMLILAIPTFVFFLATFFVSLVPYCKQMIQFKRKRILELTRMLEETRPKSGLDLDTQTIAKIEFLEKQRKNVIDLPEWPIFRGTFLGIFASSIATVWPILINVSVSIWTKEVLAKALD
jgi:hypothetical protein